MMNFLPIFLAQLYKKNSYGAMVRKMLHNVDKKLHNGETLKKCCTI